MDNIKPLTIGIVALLLITLSFNFIPKDSSNKQTKTNTTTSLEAANSQAAQTLITQESQTQESKELNATIEQSNAKLIQKNIEFLKENIKLMQQERQVQYLEESLLQTIEDSNLTQTSQPQITQESQDLQDEIPQCVRDKPQLAIIIDDISNFMQYQTILNINYKITPSLFPKNAFHKDTSRIAKVAPFYMVHLPLEALNFYQREHRWLNVGDSKEKIENYIASIKQDFPDLTYINNHTGSKFTQDPNSMKLLLETLLKYKINFLDSKTIANTYTNTFYANHKNALLNPCQKIPLKRDVFLDNELEIPKITQNLIQAVKIAKTQGYAIAIGHPHRETMLALKNAEDYLAKSGIELVYVNEIITP